MKDAFLLENDAHEQAITHKLAVHLQNEFRSYDVDCEYNRHLLNSKLYYVEDGVNSGRPDIVIHKRGNDSRNLLVIEVKKQDRLMQIDSNDSKKLSAFTAPSSGDPNDYGYKHGLFIAFDGPDHINLIWFTGGTETLRLQMKAIAQERQSFLYVQRLPE